MPVDIQSLIHKLEQSRPLAHLLLHRSEAERISNYYSARKVFERWRDSEEGKSWKAAEFQKVKGVCAGCKNTYFIVNNFEIDHKMPLSKFPELAMEINNLQILCSTCNRCKGNRALSKEDTILYYLANP